MRKTVTIAALAAVLLSACTSNSPDKPAPPAAGDGVHQGAWTPAQLGMVAATGDPAVMPSTPGFSPGIIYFCRVYVDQSRASNDAFIAVVTAGTGLTQSYLGVYDPATHKLLASTEDVSASLQQSTPLRLPLNTVVPAESVNKELWIAVLIGKMTKSPAVIGGREYGTNIGLTDDYRLWVSKQDGYSALPTTAPEMKVPDHSSLPFVGIGP
ncbi:hypothetical protein [Fodinicola feengrottensis]|uniref:Uncharacterized protein n=1 Tax=Fodinicola feengrottensis TaxID=435914 RepID=A0ABP4RMQ1_9ACTN|nr:hypothetical protein [Fodinicola feengrottensis]